MTAVLVPSPREFVRGLPPAAWGILLGLACAGVDRLMLLVGARISWDDGSAATVDIHRTLHPVVDTAPALLGIVFVTATALAWAQSLARQVSHTAGRWFAAATTAVIAGVIGNAAQLLSDRGVANWARLPGDRGFWSTGDIALLTGAALLLFALLQVIAQIRTVKP